MNAGAAGHAAAVPHGLHQPPAAGAEAPGVGIREGTAAGSRGDVTGTDPHCPFAQMAEVFGETTIWLPVTDTGLTDADIASLSISMVSWRGAGISLPTPMHSPEADSSSAWAPKARSTSRTRR